MSKITYAYTQPFVVTLDIKDYDTAIHLLTEWEKDRERYHESLIPDYANLVDGITIMTPWIENSLLIKDKEDSHEQALRKLTPWAQKLLKSIRKRFPERYEENHICVVLKDNWEDLQALQKKQ